MGWLRFDGSAERGRASKRKAAKADRAGWEAVDAGLRVEQARAKGRRPSRRDLKRGI